MKTVYHLLISLLCFGLLNSAAHAGTDVSAEYSSNNFVQDRPFFLLTEFKEFTTTSGMTSTTQDILLTIAAGYQNLPVTIVAPQGYELAIEAPKPGTDYVSYTYTDSLVITSFAPGRRVPIRLNSTVPGVHKGNIKVEIGDFVQYYEVTGTVFASPTDKLVRIGQPGTDYVPIINGYFGGRMPFFANIVPNFGGTYTVSAGARAITGFVPKTDTGTYFIYPNKTPSYSLYLGVIDIPKGTPAGTYDFNIKFQNQYTQSIPIATLEVKVVYELPPGLNPPTVSATNFAVVSKGLNSAKLIWTKGNGTNRAVFVAAGNKPLPTFNNIVDYIGDTFFKMGTPIDGAGWYCVYNDIYDTGNTVNVSGLETGDYRAIVVEYNKNSLGKSYIGSYPSLNITIDPPPPPPTQSAHDVVVSNKTSNSFTLNWINGNGVGRVVFIAKGNPDLPLLKDATIYYGNGQYGNVFDFPGGWSCVYRGTGNTVNVTNLTAGFYKVVVIEYTLDSTTPVYIKTDLEQATITTEVPSLAPTVPSAWLVFNKGTTTNSAKLSWNKGNGIYSAVFVAAGNPALPSIANGTTYTADTNFGLGTQVGSSGWYCVYNGTGSAADITNLPGGRYKAVVVDYNYNGVPGDEKYVNKDLGTATANLYWTPTQQASNLAFSNITRYTAKASWTNGNGTARVVLIAEGNRPMPAVVNGATYTPGQFTGLSGSWYCVYNGTGNNVNVSGQAWSTYSVAVIEYNGASGFEQYLKTDSTGNLKSFDTLDPEIYYGIETNGLINTFIGAEGKAFPGEKIKVLAAPGLNVKIVAPPSFTISETSDFSSPVDVIKYTGTGSTKNIWVRPSFEATGEQADYIRFYGDGFLYRELPAFTFLSPRPVIKLRDEVDSTVTIYANYAMGSFGFSTSEELGDPDKFNVYDENKTTRYFTGSMASRVIPIFNWLKPGDTQTFHFNATNSKTGGTSFGRKIIVKVFSFIPPTQVSHSIVVSNKTNNSATLSWTSGSGTGRVVFMAAGNPPMPTTVNGVDYTAYNAFRLGTRIGSTGWYCVYNGTGNTVNVNNLDPGVYRVVVIDYNGAPPTNAYATTGLAPASVTIGTPPPVAPTQVSYGLIYSNTTTNSTTLSWTNGSGANRAVFIASGNPGMPPVAKGATYTANTAFGSGSQVGTSGWYCIYNGTGTSVNISNLTAGAYRSVVIDYNGTAATSTYLTTGLSPFGVTIPSATPVAPTQVSYGLTFSNKTTNSATLSWTNGNGAARAVFIAAGNPAMPPTVNNTNYAANAAFGSGSQVGSSGWYCIYNGTGTSVNISNLTAGTYRAVVVDYNGTAETATYVTSGLAPVSTTIGTVAPVAPTQVSYRLTFTNITTNSATLTWTNGNGANRAVFIAAGNPGMPPTANGTIYTANTAFGSGSQVSASGWYCIYNGAGNTTNITNLTAGTYRAVVIDYNGTAASTAYITSGLAPVSVTIGTPPPVAPSQVSYGLTFTNTTQNGTSISWMNGNGTARAVFMAEGVAAMPTAANGTTYTANTTFASGSQIGSSGWYCVYNGAANSVAVSGLSATTQYRVVVIDYNGATGAQAYVPTGLAPAYVTTIGNGGSGFRSSLALNTLDGSSNDAPEVEVANILSPNGDGKNDTWIVKNIEAYPNSVVTILSNDGRQIYTKKAYQNDWNGGGSLTKGTYYYTIDLGNGKNLKGYITVL